MKKYHNEGKCEIKTRKFSTKSTAIKVWGICITKTRGIGQAKIVDREHFG